MPINARFVSGGIWDTFNGIESMKPKPDPKRKAKSAAKGKEPSKRKEPFGRPSKYDPKYCQQIIDWFNKPPYDTDKDGKKVANPIPTLEKFAHTLGVSRDTIHEWSRVHPDFSDACKKAKELQEYFWQTNSLLGLFPPAFACFYGKNIFGWRDQQNVEHSGSVISNIKVEFVDVESGSK